ncbi:hypothetical protein OQA88_5396 [Cercophora sp. LCS_1]
MASSNLFSLQSQGLAAVSLLVVIVVLGLALRLFKSRKSPTPAIETPHILQFPPSRRHVLAGLSQFEKSVSTADIPPTILKSHALPSTKAGSLTIPNQYTPTGFSTQDIHLIGRFPDYSLLTGIRAPVPVPPEWDVTRAKFRPYRPFRWNYHQHMALQKFEPDFWIELEQNYHATMAARQSLLTKHASMIFFESPSPACALAVRELMEMALQFLTQRYPSHFSLSPDNTLFHNRLLGTTTNLLGTPPLRVLFDNVPEDYAIMLRNESTGFYHLRAAAVCSSVGWHIGQHRDSPLRNIHTHVPDAEKMAMSMDRWFSKVPTDGAVNRCSWSLEDWQAMFTTPELEEDWQRSAFTRNPDNLEVKDVKLRCDAQTIRRLPVSGAVVFNFKAIFTPLEELRGERYVPALLLKVLREGKGNLIEYKCVEHVKRVAGSALAMWAREQVGQGLVERDWEVGTLDESPFFPGWEEKWRASQGF